MNKELKIIITPIREMFRAVDTGYGIVACKVGIETEDSKEVEYNSYGNFVVKGSMPEMEYGKNYVTTVVKQRDKKNNDFYQLMSVPYEDFIIGRDAQKIFLQSLLTTRQVEEIFKAYPTENVLELMNEDKFDHNLVKGIGEVTYQKIRGKIQKNIQYGEAIIKLSKDFGINNHNLVRKLCDEYGSPTLLIQKITENPYILADEVSGIGFKKADEIAMKIGIEKKSPKRIEACMVYCLKQEMNNGNCWIKKKKLAQYVSETINVRMKDVNDVFTSDESSLRKKLHIEADTVGLKSIHMEEQNISKHIDRLLQFDNGFHIYDIDKRIYEVEQEQGFEFTWEQTEAIRLAVEKNILIVNGKAGTGKTSVLKGILKVLMPEDSELKYATCALSGKASQRIQESTGLESSTIHRLIGFQEQSGASYGEGHPIEHDIIVLDEASMVNSQIFSSLISAVKDGAKFIILGDVAQLEAIGAGRVLADLIESGKVPTVELTIVHRQAQESGILSIANGVREGKTFVSSKETKRKKFGKLKDLFLSPNEESEDILEDVLKVARSYSGNILDFQLIVPLKERGILSVSRLNKELQDIFNGEDKRSMSRKDIIFKEGDKVIQNGNDYDKGIFNGTIGIIEYIDEAKQILVVDYPSVGHIEYSKDELKQIDLAYALTAHRTQGSQFKNIVFAFDFSSYVLLNRQIIYTALTRAEGFAYLACNLRALNHAVKTDNSIKRNTYLLDILKKVA